MSAYRLNGGRVFYVEHECQSALSKNPDKRHMLHGHVHNAAYIVRMFYRGDLDSARTDVDSFAYMTDNVAGTGETRAYVNCPLCGSEGRIAVDKEDRVEIKDAFGSRVAQETPFR